MIILRKPLIVFLNLIYCMVAYSQAIEPTEYRTMQLEATAEKNESEPEDDSYEMDLDFFSKHPLNMNTVSEEDLSQLQILEVSQIKNFISYRKLLGPLLSLHELQAVPAWDIETIRKLLPYIMISREGSVYSAVKERWKGGDSDFLMRMGQVVEKSKGYLKPVKPGDSYYEGNAEKIFIRYTYNYKQLLAFGFTGEKDAGEPFFRGAQKYGFDFYSFHFFLQHAGLIRALAIGDFSVNMGQGLIQWQSFAFTKTNQVLSVKRESPFLRPYHSAGEFNFHRGIGISFQKEKWQSSLFISTQMISTSLRADTAGRDDLFSSFQNSGYHRTATEIADRNNSRQSAAGANIRFTDSRFMLSFNWIQFQFSRAFQKPDELYNLFSLKGKKLADYSFDYNYTIGNLHLFGEFALDKWWNPAFVQGGLLSLGENIDMSFFYRNISPAFKSIYGDAFTENSFPNNEKGFYTGLAFKPIAGLQINMYYDVFVFPWLKYRVDGPSYGRDYSIFIVYKPDKSWQLTSSYRNEMKTGNAAILNERTHGLYSPVKKRWQIETDNTISRLFSFTGRMEFVWISMNGMQTGQGFLGMAGINFKKSGSSGNITATVFETDDYDSRIYIYEPDLPFNISLPVYYGRGLHYYINLHQDIGRIIPHVGKHFRLSAWLKWSQTFYPGSASIGTGLDEINGNRKSEIKAEILIQWQ